MDSGICLHEVQELLLATFGESFKKLFSARLKGKLGTKQHIKCNAMSRENANRAAAGRRNERMHLEIIN